MHDSTYSSGGRPAKLAFNADISTAEGPQPLGEWVLFVETRVLQVGEECFATRPHALDSRMVNGKIQVFVTWLDDP
jgi:hypothetical protein